MSKDYEHAKELGLTSIDRWQDDRPHHPLSIRLGKFLEQHDFHDHDDSFGWSFGGDGDNGENLLYQMDCFFEYLDRTQEPLYEPK